MGRQATTRTGVNLRLRRSHGAEKRLCSGRHFFHAAREQVRLCLSGFDARLKNSVNFAILRTSFAKRESIDDV
jgi:hypothetical protein